MNLRPAIVVYGTAGCLKSTIVRLAMTRRPITHLAPFQFGPGHNQAGEPDRALRERRYRRLFSALDESPSNDTHLLVEGCFDPLWAQITLADALSAISRRVLFVRCWTSDPSVTYARLSRRVPNAKAGIENTDAAASLEATLEIPRFLRDLRSTYGAHISFDSIRGGVEEDWIDGQYRAGTDGWIREILSEVI